MSSRPHPAFAGDDAHDGPLPFTLQLARAFAPEHLTPEVLYDVTEGLARLRRARPSGRRDKVLIIATRRDDHADQVALELVGSGTPVMRLNVEDYPERATLSLALDGAPPVLSGALRLPAGELDLSEVRSVWLRRRLSELFGLGPPAGDRAAFVERESRAAFAAMFGLLDQAFWVSSPAAVFAADSKIDQLTAAADLGFVVPATLVTNDPDRAREFIEAQPLGTVVKAFRGQVGATLETTRLIYTTRITPPLLETIDLVRHGPCLFQAEVPRQSDVRVTVIGRQLFSVEIEPLDDPSGADVDSRALDPYRTRYDAVELPAEVRDACLALLDRYHLVFGAIDLIRRPDGGYVFLELNTKGDWTWLERRTGLEMTAAMAALLRSGEPG